MTVYTKPACVQCNGTFRTLDKHGVDYETVNLPDHPEALDTIREMGFMQAPVVVVRPDGATEDVDWSGLRPDLIEQHITGPQERN